LNPLKEKTMIDGMISSKQDNNYTHCQEDSDFNYLSDSKAGTIEIDVISK
jgi:hypothetical protein